MSYRDIEARYRELKAQFNEGALTEEAFKTQLEELMLQDDQGRWWIIGYETGEWYVYEGEQWVQATPPEPAPPPPDLTMQGAPIESQEAAPAADVPADEASVVLLEAALPVAGLPIFETPVAAQEALPIADVSAHEAFSAAQEAPPAAVAAAPRLWQSAAEPKAGRASFAAALKVPWIPWVIATIGWGLAGWFFRLPIYYGSNLSLPWGFDGLFDGLIGGAATMWACRWPGRAWGWTKAAILVAGWGIVSALSRGWLGLLFGKYLYSRISSTTIEAVGALAGGLLLAAVLRWAGEPLTRRQMAIISGGWAAASIVASLVAGGLLFNKSGLFGSILASLIFGAIGGWITLAQLAQARHGIGETQATPAPEGERRYVSASGLSAAAWPRWAPVLISAIGWGISFLLFGSIALTNADSWPVGLALAFVLGGAVMAFICRRAGVPLRGSHVLVMLLVSPLLIGLILRWANPAFRWRHVGILAAAWALAAGVGFGVASAMARSVSGILAFALWGLVAGALGGWATLDQLARARRAAAS